MDNDIMSSVVAVFLGAILSIVVYLLVSLLTPPNASVAAIYVLVSVAIGIVGVGGVIVTFNSNSGSLGL